MKWPSIREFLEIPSHLTGKDVNIAIIDGKFPTHPDIASNERRNTYLVRTTNGLHAKPMLLKAKEGVWKVANHGLCTASAAGGSGSLSNGIYTGAAPDANLYLLECGSLRTSEEVQGNIGEALFWLKQNWKKYNIRGAVLTIVGQIDTGLLPWQADPIRILCEELIDDGLFIVSSSGNYREVTSGSTVSPSMLNVGGVYIPFKNNIDNILPFHGSRGLTFDGKWNPDVLAPAGNVMLPFPYKNEEEKRNHYTANEDNLPFPYARQWGTSFAGPVVLGFAACLWQVNPDWDAKKMKMAIINGTISHQNWKELKAGLISVRSLKGETSGLQEENSYSNWQRYKSKSENERLRELEKNHNDYEILISFFPEGVTEHAEDIIKNYLYHTSFKVRVAALLALSCNQNAVQKWEIENYLMDSNPFVKMAGLFVLKKYESMWKHFTHTMADLINDGNSDIRYNATKLAISVKDKSLIEPLVDGMEEDARKMRIATFGNRCMALEVITGYEIELDTEWREGEDPYSEGRMQTRLYMTRKWKEYVEEFYKD
ncbi:S8 family serine peptidase [Bacillus sp. APMAM]|nr:S8 family serine peptidase [Bacillus sp. APMAM]